MSSDSDKHRAVGPALAIVLFAASAALTFAAAGFFADRLDHLGPRLGFPEAVVGLLTAFAADTPEIASALVALAHGNKDVSLGVVLGSNVFNVAAMLGLSAVITGAVMLRRRALMIEGAVSLLSLLITAGLIVGVFPAWVAVGLLLGIVVPYLVVTLRNEDDHGTGKQPRHEHHEGAILKTVALIIPAIVLIVVGSTGMVRAALSLADHWDVSETVTGILVLAVLTSLPNAYTAIRLGMSGRGDALVTETLASNTINLIGGVLIPALVVGIAPSSGKVKFDLLWLFGMTGLALVLLGARRGLGRTGGIVLVGLYVVFVTVQLAVS